MVVLQLISRACSVSVHTNGISRVVLQLSDYFVHSLGIRCCQAYLEGAEHAASPAFSATFHYTPDNPQGFHAFLRDNNIDIIVFNFAVDDMIAHIPAVCKIAHSLNVRVVFWPHFMPGKEGYSFGSWNEVRYGFKERKAVVDKTKKWLVSSLQPMSAWAIHKLLKNKYVSAYQCCDRIVVFSEPYVDRFLQIIGGGDRDKFTVIPNPMSFPELLSKKELRAKRKEVLYVGRFHEPQKRVSIALEIWKMVENNPALDDWSFRIIGDGEGEGFLRWVAEKNNLRRVCFEGRHDPRLYYKRASVLMSTSSYEGWPMVLMEAMPMGCCCVAFDSYDAIHDFIEDGENGCIVKNNDVKGYYQRLEELMMNEDKRIEMGTNAIESSQRFSMEKVAAKWQRLLLAEKHLSGD